VAGRRGAIVGDNLYNKFETMSAQAGKRDKILAVHVQRICEAHRTVIQCYYQQIYGSSEADATTSMENLREQVYVEMTLNDFVTSCRRKVKAAQSLSNMNEPMALHTEGTAKVSEWINMYDNAKKLY